MKVAHTNKISLRRENFYLSFSRNVGVYCCLPALVVVAVFVVQFKQKFRFQINWSFVMCMLFLFWLSLWYYWWRWCSWCKCMRVFRMIVCADVCVYVVWQRTSVEAHSFVSFRLFPNTFVFVIWVALYVLFFSVAVARYILLYAHLFRIIFASIPTCKFSSVGGAAASVLSYVTFVRCWSTDTQQVNKYYSLFI